jgi:tyrosine-specific transport protein
MNHSFVLALSTLVGTIVGAGIFGVPFVMAKSGLLPAVFYFVLLGGSVMLLHLFFGEIALRTKEKHRLIGYSRKYLGKTAAGLAIFSTIFGIAGSLLAYIILGGNFLFLAFGSWIPLSETAFTVLFWLFLSFFIARGIQLIAKAEFVMNLALFLTIGAIFFFAAPHIKLENFSLVNIEHLFLPYGVLLFAFAGWAAIPEIGDFFKRTREKKQLDNVVVWASLITVGLYFLFGVFVVGVSGGGTTPDALSGLEPIMGRGIVLLGAVFGLVAIAASFLILGNYLKNSMRHDFHLSLPWAIAISIIPPILFFFLGFREFIAVLGLVGVVIGIIEGTLIVLAYQKAKTMGDRTPEYSLRLPKAVPMLVALVLIGGALAELLFSYFL